MRMPVRNAAMERLAGRLRGVLIRPGDPDYDDARAVFNAMIDRRPALIAQCADAGDVQQALRFGREHDLDIAVRGGGHGVAGKAVCDGGLVLDLRRMNHVTVDPHARTATVGGGATIGDLDGACAPFGLATTGGRVSTTGVGGFALGGGSGWLDRKLGLACDNLLAVELITADGNRLTASPNHHPELFWALHGGGGNFGVATTFTFRLHELDHVFVAAQLFDPKAGDEVTRVYRDFMLAAPDEVGGGLLYLTAPSLPGVPETLAGRLALGVLVVVAAPEATARRIAAPVLDLPARARLVTPMPYADLQCLLDDKPGQRNFWSATHLVSLPDEAIKRFGAQAPDMLVPSASQQVLYPQGGAVERAPTDFPVPWRHAPWVVHPVGLWRDPADDARCIRWARTVRADLAPWAAESTYLNFVGDEGEHQITTSYGPAHYPRLARIKARYDPDNVFHGNHNIRPHPADPPAGS